MLNDTLFKVSHNMLWSLWFLEKVDEIFVKILFFKLVGLNCEIV